MISIVGLPWKMNEMPTVRGSEVKAETVVVIVVFVVGLLCDGGSTEQEGNNGTRFRGLAATQKVRRRERNRILCNS